MLKVFYLVIPIAITEKKKRSNKYYFLIKH